MTEIVKIQREAIDTAALFNEAVHFGQDFGAQVVFTGFVRRDDYKQPISHLYIDHYPIVTEKEIAKIVACAKQKWSVIDIMVVHRIEEILVGEAIVWVMTQAKSRIDAYAANAFIMDYLKVAAPFWKKECFENLEEKWVEAKQTDLDKFETWGHGL